MEGDEATAASPGLSAAASPFAAVLENWAPMLASSTKKLNRSKRGNKEPWVGVTTGRAAAAAAAAATAAAAHTPEGGGGGGEEDRRDPIKYTPDKKILVEEIKKQQHRREGKRWKSRAQKRSPSVVFFLKKKKEVIKKSQICSRTVDKRKMEKSPWLLIRCGVQRPSAQMNGLAGADAAPARAGQSARRTQSRGRGLRSGRTMEPRFANGLKISLRPRINVLQINKSIKKYVLLVSHGLNIIMHLLIGLLCLESINPGGGTYGWGRRKL